jgi:hypothetical protein
MSAEGAEENSPGRKPGVYRSRLIHKPALAGGRKNLLSPAKAGLRFYVRRPRVPLASLATPWAKFCRLLRRLVEPLTLPCVSAKVSQPPR